MPFALNPELKGDAARLQGKPLVDWGKPMRLLFVCTLAGAAFSATLPAAQAAGIPSLSVGSSDMRVAVGARRQRPVRDCTPTNGPYGFYGNIWCQPPNDASYLRNLGASWPMKTPPNLKKPVPHDTGSDW